MCTWVCVRVRGQAVFTHPLLWLVLRMSFWPNGFWDCEAWEQISTDDAPSCFHDYASGAGKDGGVGTWSARGGGRPAGRPRPAAGRRWWEPAWWWLDHQLVQTDKREREKANKKRKKLDEFCFILNVYVVKFPPKDIHLFNEISECT